MLEKYEDEILDGILSQLSEHFPNYAIAVMSEDGGDLHYDYSNWRIGRMLMRDSIEDMSESVGAGEDWSWDEDEEDADE